MNEFLLVFRQDHEASTQQLSPEQMQAWMQWFGALAANGQLANSGKRLAPHGKVVKSNQMVTNGPYVELKESMGGYIIVKANDVDEAAEVAKGCPILQAGGNVEVRPIIPVEAN